MRNVKDIVGGFLSDTSRREVKPLTEEEKRQIAKHDERPKAQPVQQQSGPVRRLDPEVHAAFNPKRDSVIEMEEDRSSQSAETASGPCEFGDNGKHLWTWEKGVKQCGWCEKKAPVDRRDSSTSWKAKVYGVKK